MTAVLHTAAVLDVNFTSGGLTLKYILDSNTVDNKYKMRQTFFKLGSLWPFPTNDHITEMSPYIFHMRRVSSHFLDIFTSTKKVI